MMSGYRLLMRIVRFFGGVYLACGIILALAVCVAYGTVVEARTDSHARAVQSVYSSSLFDGILCLAFINIFTSTLLRWPFRRHHIPFLLVHLGLLMVIAGTVGKHLFGVQGITLIREGGESHTLIIPGSHSLLVETSKEDWRTPQSDRLVLGERLSVAGVSIGSLTVDIEALSPHAESGFDSWVKEGNLSIRGLPERPLSVWNPTMGQIQPLLYIEDGSERVALYACKTRFRERFLEGIGEAEESWIACVQDPFDGSVSLEAWNRRGGRGKRESFSIHAPSPLYAYREGFDGYGLVYSPPKGLFSEEIDLETPLQPVYRVLAPLEKRELNRPLIRLKASEGEKSEAIDLLYSPKNEGLKWPLLGGDYRVRFEPVQMDLPFSIRLHRATKLTYPNSPTPYHYEALLWIEEERKEQRVELSMNHTYETASGYRIYLSQVIPATAQRPAAIQCAINRDPFRWRLTYPGAIILCVGTLLLFSGLFRRRRGEDACS